MDHRLYSGVVLYYGVLQSFALFLSCFMLGYGNSSAFDQAFFAVPLVVLLVVESVIVFNPLPCVTVVDNAKREQLEENVNQHANEMLEIAVSCLFLCSESLKLLSNRGVKI